MFTAKLNLKAIAGADHMVSPEADKHDFDRWYRNTIEELLMYAAGLHDVISGRDHEIEVLTVERNNALLRIEALEQDIEYWKEYQPWSQPDDTVVPDWNARGGVNPNA